MVYAVVQLLMAISALASLSGLDPAASVQVIGGWRIGLRVAWFTLGLVFAGNCVLYLIGGWLGRRAGADTSKSRPFMALMWLSAVTTLIGLLAARATTSGWEAWFSLLIAVIHFPIRDQSRKAQHAHLSGDIGGWPTDERNAANRRCCE